MISILRRVTLFPSLSSDTTVAPLMTFSGYQNLEEAGKQQIHHKGCRILLGQNVKYLGIFSQNILLIRRRLAFFSQN